MIANRVLGLHRILSEKKTRLANTYKEKAISKHTQRKSNHKQNLLLIKRSLLCLSTCTCLLVMYFLAGALPQQ
jgi:hypothetical protein